MKQDTFFAEAERLSPAETQRQSAAVRRNPVVARLEGSIPDLFALLNRHRQIVYANGPFLQFLKTSSLDAVCGRRPGEALSYGLVNKVVPLENVMAEAKAMAQKLLTKSGAMLALVKRAATSGAGMSLSDGLDLEAQCFSLCFATEDQKEGMKAFMEKRKADFKNR